MLRPGPILFFFQGCYKTVYDWIITNLNIVIIVAVAILGVQILGIIFAFCLCKAVGSERDFHYKYWAKKKFQDQET